MASRLLINQYQKDILPEDETFEDDSIIISNNGESMHFKVKDPNQGATVNFQFDFIPIWFWILYFTIIIFIAAILAILVMFAWSRFPVLELFMIKASCIIVTLLAGCFFCDSLSYMKYNYFIINWVILYAISLAIDSLTFSFLGTVLIMVFTTIWYVANYFVILYRGKPIMPADLKAIGTAKEVMGGYGFIPNWKVVVGVVIIVLYAAMLVHIYKRSKKSDRLPIYKSIIKRGITFTIAVLLIVIVLNSSVFKSLDSFAWDTALMKSFHEEGMVLTFVKSVYNSVIKEPEGYSREIVESYLKEYEEQQDHSADVVQPTRIVMIMDEAFSDLRTVGLNNKINVMPFIDSLQKNTVEGNLYVSIIGGGLVIQNLRD